VDGNDVLAVYQVTLEAARRARDSNEPTLIEAITFRRGVHTTADDPRVYRSVEEEERWTSKDPIRRVHDFLTSRGAWSAADQDALENRINDEIAAALLEAEAFRDGSPDPLIMFDHVYETMDPYLARQREEAREAFEGRLVISGKGKAKVGNASTAVVGELEMAED
jgi:TPP-dependent pyruvate/acetoin dehydrogenase alpha subunit